MMLRSRVASVIQRRPAKVVATVSANRLPIIRHFASSSSDAPAAENAENSNANKNKTLNFDNPSIAFGNKSTWEVARAWTVFQVCRINLIVKNAPVLYNTSKKILGSTLTHGSMRGTFFNHFCGGETVADLDPVIQELRKQGVGAILDYAAEVDADEEPETPEVSPSGDDSDASAASGPASQKLARKETMAARTYAYQTEAQCDAVAKIFHRGIDAQKHVSADGFSAIKLSGLGNPALLKRFTSTILEMRTFLVRLGQEPEENPDTSTQTPGTASLRGDRPTQMTEVWNTETQELTISERKFKKGFRYFFEMSDEEVQKLWDNAPKSEREDGKHVIDFWGWTRVLDYRGLSDIVRGCRHKGPLYAAALTQEEIELVDKMLERVGKLAEHAHREGVHMMIDAEWTNIQPAIDFMVLGLQRKYNVERPIIFQTYQSYLKGSLNEVTRDLSRANREGYHFGAKLVRGAYVVAENEAAEKEGRPSPIWESYERTEQNFHQAIDAILNAKQVKRQEVLIASHNVRSMKHALSQMQKLNLDPATGGVYFGQLLGMADHITFTLGRNGYKAYKYVPYGPIDEVMPYLIRRAQENSALLGAPGVAEERAMLSSELKNRVMSSQKK